MIGAKILAVADSYDAMTRETVKNSSQYAGNPGNPGNPDNPGSLMLKGSFHQSSISSIKGFDASMSINRVVLVSLRSFRIQNINADNFSLDVSDFKGQALGLVFISTSNQVAGCLQLVANSTDTLDLLPLTKIREGVREIDLQAISFSTDTYGDIAIPTYDPVSATGEIPFSDKEKTAAAKATEIYAHLNQEHLKKSVEKLDII